MLDMLIGSNDGVPFIVPGVEGIVTEPKSYRGQETPHFIQALEVANLAAPGVVAYVGFRAGRVEQPSEVVLTHWPGSGGAEWNYDRTRAFGTDTAVGIYYEPKPLAPGAIRTVAFTYGLGSISPPKSAKLSLTAGGPFRSGGEFYVAALVQNPKEHQVVRLRLPNGLTLKPKDSSEKVVPRGDNYTQLSWLVQIDGGFFGEAEVKATLEPDGVEEVVKYLVQPRDVRLILRPQKPPLRVGKRFWVSALVQNPRKGQTVELKLPSGFVLSTGHEVRKSVPLAKGSGRSSQVDWLVQASQPTSEEIAVVLSPDGVEDKVSVKIEHSSILGDR